MESFNYYILIVYLLISYNLFPQNEANIWHFGEHHGLDFNSGNPVKLTNTSHNSIRGNATMSDSSGNFLFSFSGEQLWNREGHTMQNGNDIIGESLASQGTLIVPLPGSDKIYYIFTVPTIFHPFRGFHYSVIDMELDGGLGGVVVGKKNIVIDDDGYVLEKLTAVKHNNNQDIWIIARKLFFDDAYRSYLLTSSGLNTDPVINEVRHLDYNTVVGTMKVSLNKKYLAVAYTNDDASNSEKQFVDICSFNAETGEIELLFEIGKNIIPGSQNEPWAVEFSPDSKFLYLTYFNETGSNFYELFQYDMQYIYDSSLFMQSEVFIDSTQVCGLQLARDGKIYGTGNYFNYHYGDYFGVINKPWKRGTACDFERDAIYIGEDAIPVFFQNIMLDYLYRFEWEGSCSGSPIQFKPNFINPLEIIWDFGDGSPPVTETNPEHIYNAAGEYEVHVTVEYYDTTAFMNQRIEETSRVVTIKQSPEPDLGGDIIVCESTQITLDAGTMPGTYTWENDTATIAFGQNLYQMTVSDTGNYRVRVRNTSGCSGYDTIYVGWYPTAQINEQNLQVQPTTPGGSTGSITGLMVDGTPPLTFQWYDSDGNIVGDTLDLYNLSEGNYYLEITDGNGCVSLSRAYTISSGTIVIDSVDTKDSHCGQDTGEIIIYASSHTGGPFEYSIDNGISWQSSNTFINLGGGSYTLRARELGNGETPWSFNPVEILDIAGPQITNITTIPETNHTSNGEIVITATSTEDSLWYSIDNGQTYQYNNGSFTGLAAGIYICVVKDRYGCEAEMAVEIISHNTQLVEAIAGDDYACIGNAATNPLIVSDFKDIKRFNAVLEYDNTMLTCEGYTNIVEELEEGITITTQTNNNKVYINWEGTVPLTLQDKTTILELVFKCNEEGLTGISWEASPGESNFYNELGEEIPASYTMGQVRIFSRPEIILGNSQSWCEGEEVTISPFVMGGSGEVISHWDGPNGYSQDGELLWIPNIQQNMQGTYTLEVQDTANCTEAKQTEVVVIPSPQISFNEYDTLWAEQGYVLDAGSEGEYYIWNTGSTSSAIIIDTAGEYSVQVTSEDGCKSTDSVYVLWDTDPFILPNAFTPNGDGLNDTYGVVARYDYAKLYSLSIYNRWGQKIFESADINTKWDGTYKGTPCMTGSYIVRISYREYDSRIPLTKVQQGTVMLVR